MSLDQARQAITDAFQTEFATAYPGVPIAFENVRFKQPTNAAWVHFAMIPGDAVRRDISTGKYRHYGVINVTILVPQDTGTKESTELTDKVFSIVADRQWSTATGSLKTYGAQRRTRGVINGWYTRNVMLEFRYDSSVER